MLRSLSLTIAFMLPQLAFGQQLLEFFEQNCMECHDDLTMEGQLDLFQADPEMPELDQVDLWTRIHDRVAAGEMPPADEPQPTDRERMAFLQILAPQLESADRGLREVVQRRLNRIEYRNTLRDLLGVEIDVERRLPEDQEAGGFDNNGAALALSTELLQEYLAIAHEALDLVIEKGPRPESTTRTTDSLGETQRYIDSHQYGFKEGRVIQHLTARGQYSKISTRGERTTAPGVYRFRFEAVAVNSDTPLTFAITASDFRPSTAVFTNLGYFEATPEPKEFELEFELGPKHAIQFFALGLPTWLKKPALSDNPGIGYGPVEITGPIYDQWPPEPHTRLLGDTNPDDGTREDAKRVLAGFLPRAFRRSVEPGEIDRFLALFDRRMEAGRGFEASLRAALAAVLCSPNFLYIREEAKPDARTITTVELASRLSYGLWCSMPDEALMALAASGELRKPAVLRQQVDRMLDDPKGDEFVTNFVGQWLHMRDISETVPDTKLYKNFDELLHVSMVWECESFFREILTRNLDIANFLDSDFAMLNERLAEVYGVEGVHGISLRPVTLPEDSPRGGVLTQAGVLKVTANGTNTSPVIRGAWVLENILGQEIPPPPPNIPGIEPDIRGATTVREQLDLHRSVESCNRCHRREHAPPSPPGPSLEHLAGGISRDWIVERLTARGEADRDHAGRGGRVRRRRAGDGTVHRHEAVHRPPLSAAPQGSRFGGRGSAVAGRACSGARPGGRQGARKCLESFRPWPW